MNKCALNVLKLDRQVESEGSISVLVSAAKVEWRKMGRLKHWREREREKQKENGRIIIASARWNSHLTSTILFSLIHSKAFTVHEASLR